MALKPPPIQDNTITPDNRFYQTWILWFQSIYTNLISIYERLVILERAHGWAYYDDSQYTSGSPLSITSGRTQLTINALGASNNTTYLPEGVTNWWSANAITPSSVGDAYVLRFDMTCVAGSNADKFALELQIDTGNLVFAETLEMNKGIGATHYFSVSIPIFTLNTFLANGGKFFINTTNSFTVYNLGILITRLHAA